MSAFDLTVSSPGGNIFKGKAQRMILRGAEGDLAVLAGHIPFITTVQPCKCHIETEDGVQRIGKTEGGLLTVSKDSVTLLSGVFTWIE